MIGVEARVDTLSLVAWKYRKMVEAGRQRLAVQEWYEQIPADKTLSKADLEPLVLALEWNLYVAKSDAHMDMAWASEMERRLRATEP